MRFRCQAVTMIGLLMAILLPVFIFRIPVSAEQTEFPDVSKARAVYFYHMESKRVIGSKEETRQFPAGASLKVLSGLVACEQLADKLNQTVVITSDMIRNPAGYSYRHFKEGDIYTYERLLYLAVCGSYNDAYDVLAYIIGNGNIQAFVELMNQRAKELGAEQTIAADPTGIADSSLTSAQDLFRISMAAFEDPLYMQICGSVSYYDDGIGGYIYNRNALISSGSYSYDASYYASYLNSKCTGMSAGATKLGKASVITVAQSGNDHYLCIVLGAEEDEENVYSYVIANDLIRWGYTNYSYIEVLTPDDVICKIPVTISDLTEEVEVKANESLSFYLPAGTNVKTDIVFSIRLMYDSLEAPVREGVHVGYVAVVYQGEILGTVSLFTAGSAERSSFVSRLVKIQSLTQSRRVRAGGIFFLVTIAAWILTEYFLMRHRRHKWDKYFSMKIDMSETDMKRKK